MRSHAKAASAGSTSDQASRLGPILRGALLCLAVAVATVLPASSALAVETHPFTGTSFGPKGASDPATFARVGGIAVDPATENVYAYDAGEGGRIYKFSAAGAPLDFSALGTNAIEGVGGGEATTYEYEIAVAPPGSPGGTAGDIYVANTSQSLRTYSPAGELLGEIDLGAEVCGVAVDPAGHLFIGTYPQTIREYTPTANPPTAADQSAVSSASLPGICNVAADGLGNVYASNYFGKVVKLAGIGAASATALDPEGGSLAVDFATEDLYTSRTVNPSQKSQVLQYDSSGTLVGSSGVGELIASRGLAFNSGSGMLYAGVNANHPGAILSDRIDIFAPAIVVPGLNPESTTAIGAAKATLNATINPAGLAVSECKFEYGPTTALGSSASCEGAIPADGNDHPVSAALTGLDPATKYRWRVVATNANGTSVGTIGSDLNEFQTAPTVVTGPATAIAPPSATLEGTFNPEGGAFTDCRFEYRITVGPEQTGPRLTVPCAESAAEIGTGEAPVPVHADLSGVGFGATYHYRLAATRGVHSYHGNELSFKTAGPVIEAQGVSAVTPTAATLEAEINPKGAPTSNHFEYGLNSSYGNSTPEVMIEDGEGNPIEDEAAHTVSAALVGLAPETTYHWRAVATNPAGVSEGVDRTFTTPPAPSEPQTSCPNQAFRTGPGANLPDCRAYEMVSPPQKLGQVIPPEPEGFAVSGSCNQCLPGLTVIRAPMQARPDGEAVLYQGQPFGAGLASGGNEYLARRTATGWENESLSPALFSDGDLQAYRAFSADLTRGLVFQIEPSLSPAAPSGYANIYLREPDGTLRPLLTEAPPHRSPGTASANSFKIVYDGANAGSASAAAFSHVIFGANDALTAAVPAIAPAAPEVEPGGFCVGEASDRSCNLYEWVEGELRLVNVLPGNAAAAPGAVIGSGCLLEGENCAQYRNPQVENAISADGERIFWSDASGQLYVRIGGSETREIHAPGLYLTASPDGSKVLLSDGCIYDVEAEACAEDLTQGEGGFQGILGATADLSSAYFVDTAVLTGAEENDNGEKAEEGENNLYAWHEDDLAFIGTLLDRDNEVTTFDWRAAASDRTAQVSADGRYLAFMSAARLTGYDNRARGGDPCSHAPNNSPACNEVFEYDAATATLSCPSCNPGGERPLGSSNLSLINSRSNPLPQPGNLTAEGHGRLFFESLDSLSAGDVNDGIQDVYQWDPNGVGGCERAAGCVQLISSGHSANDSMFLDATANGNDAFIVTREQLLPRDKDERLDLYDARVGGGFAEAANPPCLEAACRGPIPPAPPQQSPGSAAFNGPPNKKPGCQKQKKKCHKQKKKHRKHKKKHHKRSAKHNRGGSK